MLLIPLGVDSGVQRAWTTYAVIFLNLLVSLLVLPSAEDAVRLRSLGEQLDRIETFLHEHPYLDPPRPVQPYLDDDLLADLREARASYLAQAKPPSGPLREGEERQLTRLVGAFLDVLRDTPFHRFGFIPAEPTWWQAVTSMFVHAGWLHLLGNMLFLFIAGPLLEEVWGGAVFTGLYLLSGLAAALAHALNHPASTSPLVGASGAIAGVMGAFLIRLATTRIRLLVLPIPFLPFLRFTLWLPAFAVLPAWLLQQMLNARGADGISGTAWWAHIGGFASGIATAIAVGLLRLEERRVDRGAALQQRGSEVQALLETARTERNRGDLGAARRSLRQALLLQPQSLDAWSESFDLALHGKDAVALGQAALRLLELHVALRQLPEACAMLRTATASGLALPVKFLLAAAERLEAQHDRRGALELYQRVARTAPLEPQALTALMRQAAILLQKGEASAAHAVYAQARAHPACSAEQRDAIDAALASPTPTAAGASRMR